MPQISVIVPVYNAERYLHRCVDSILSQTFSNFELLLINDGSKDSSGAICDEYAAKDPRVRVFHKENGGVSSARNLGLDNACGEWIAFVDSDDWISENYLESMLVFDTDINFSSVSLVSESNQFNEHVTLKLSDYRDSDLICFLDANFDSTIISSVWGGGI